MVSMERATFSVAPKRRRRPVTKSSLGCTECKSRKIKCDETRPSCFRCREKGMRCSGVATGPRIRWSTKHENLHARKGASIEQSDNISQIFDAAWKSFSATQAPELGESVAEVLLSEGNHHTNDTATEPWSKIASHEFNMPDFDSLCHKTLELQAPSGSNIDCALPSTECAPHYQAPPSPMTLVSHSAFQSYPDHIATTEFDEISPHSSETPSDGSEGQKVGNNAMQIPESPRSLVPSPSAFGTSDQISIHDDHFLLSPGLVDNESELIGAYFNIVCPIFSTFDSEHNLFRSFVSERWQDSATMFYAISSMAAAKISRELPSMKRSALEYQSLAIRHLSTDVSRASCWDAQLLFVVLMLGLSTSWHVVTDLGITHLKAMQRAISEPTVQHSCGTRILQFVKEALVYWEMVICSVNDDVCVHDHLIPDSPEAVARSVYNSQNRFSTVPPRIMPHPWTGVAAAPQALFARVAHRIRQARSPRSASLGDDSIVNRPVEFFAAVNKVEEELWHLRLPALHEIANTGDPNTPAIHHLLLAEAYMFATMYQLYYIFPNARRKQAKRLRDLAQNESFSHGSWAYDQVRTWSTWLQPPSSSDRWVRFLGRNIILRLEQISDTSGTSCVHALLLLVGSASLSVAPETEGSHEAEEILRSRRFVLSRIARVSASKLSEPVSKVRSVILEIFRRLDLGLDVFWMDIMNSMGIVTIIG